MTAHNARLLPCAVAGALLAFFLVFGGTGAAGERPLLTVVESDWPPYFFAGAANSPPGFAKELLGPCLEQAGYTPSFVFYPVKRMYSHMESGKVDINLFSYKKSRESLVEYGREPIFSSSYRPFVRADADIRIRSLSDFNGLRVCHLAGLQYSDEYHAYIKKRKKEGTLVVSTLGPSCLKMLLEGMVDVFVDTRETILWRAKQMDALDKIRVADFDIQTKDYFVTFSRHSSSVPDRRAVLDAVDLCLKQAKKDGRYAAVGRKYGLK